MPRYPKLYRFLNFMNEKLTKNAKVEKFTNMLGKAVRLIVIDPLIVYLSVKYNMIAVFMEHVLCAHEPVQISFFYSLQFQFDTLMQRFEVIMQRNTRI